MLKILPGHISNLIAAGEVVQRPASVVKELMENAVDAEATAIQVVIKDSGRTLIQVTDNGSGISPEDAKIAFLRHATSKISEVEDLNRITTFGFRGEALASIAAVSEVTLKTRMEKDQTGCEVKYAESNLVYAGEASTPKGSNFMVRNLFYNVPARRKFLKSDATEYRQILSEFSRVAITRPGLSFRLVHNNTEIFNLAPGNLRKRILDVAGKEMGKELVDIRLDSPVVNIRGYIGRPEDARKTPGNQYLFANNRFFRSPYFQKAVLKAYENLIPEGHLPSYFIFFEVAPEMLDVNIHPAKTEVKFEEEYAIFDMLNAVIRESLGRNSFFPSIDFDQEGAPEIPTANARFYVPPPKIDYDPLFNPFNEELRSRRIPLSGEEIDRNFHTPPSLLKDENSSLNPVIIAGDRYILSVVSSGILVINIRRAYERIFYERYLKAVEESGAVPSGLLFPKRIIIAEQIYSILTERRNQLEKLGFRFAVSELPESEDPGSYPERIIEVTALPEGVPDGVEELNSLIDSLVFDITELGQDTGKIVTEKFAAAMARSAAYGKRETVNSLQAQSLMDSLYSCREPAYTPSGKICSEVITLEELNKRFS
jgi:DNA mismatch repair protein MutL